MLKQENAAYYRRLISQWILEEFHGQLLCVRVSTIMIPVCGLHPKPTTCGVVSLKLCTLHLPVANPEFKRRKNKDPDFGDI